MLAGFFAPLTERCGINVCAIETIFSRHNPALDVATGNSAAT
jgi:hypothetical protein